MHLHFVLDEPQYNHLLQPVIELAKRARHVVSVGDRTAQRYDADAYVVIQDFGLFGCPKPRILLSHALGLAKKVQFDLQVQLAIFPSSAYCEAVRHEIPFGTEIVAGIGSPKIDLLRSRKARRQQIQEQLRALYGFDDRPIVGYCPTFRHDGSLHHPRRSHRLRNVEEILESEWNVVVLHHSLEPDPSELEEVRFRLQSVVSRVDHLVALDCAVTDISGVGFELCAIDTPIVLLDEPSVPNYLEARILGDGRRLDYGPTCTLTSLVNSVREALASQAEYRQKRAEWAVLAFGPCDGEASKRVLEAIVRFASKVRIAECDQHGVAVSRAETVADFVASRLQFFAINGVLTRDDVSLALTLSPGATTAFYGPYLRIGAGKFLLRVELSVGDGNVATLSIDGDQGRHCYAAIPFASEIRASIPFQISEENAGGPIEFRLFVDKHTSHVAIRQFQLLYAGALVDVL